MAAFYPHGYPSTQVGYSTYTLLNFVQLIPRCIIATYYDIHISDVYYWEFNKVSMRDVEVGGHQIPADSQVFLAILPVLRNARF